MNTPPKWGANVAAQKTQAAAAAPPPPAASGPPKWGAPAPAATAKAEPPKWGAPALPAATAAGQQAPAAAPPAAKASPAPVQTTQEPTWKKTVLRDMTWPVAVTLRDCAVANAPPENSAYDWTSNIFGTDVRFLPH